MHTIPENQTLIDAVEEIQEENHALACWQVIQELRPHLADPLDFVLRWKVQQLEGYKLICLRHEGQVVAVAGYRLFNTMAWGKIIYIDDLVVMQSCRGIGYGKALLDWIKKKSEALQCNAVHLDTGYHRHRAHKTYLRNGFELSSHHMSWTKSA